MPRLHASPPLKRPWVRLYNLEDNWVDDLLKVLIPSLGWQGPLPHAKAVQEYGKKVYILTCKTDGQAKALYSILAGGESPQFPYCVSWLEVNSPKPKFFSTCCPPPSHIDCMEFLEGHLGGSVYGTHCIFRTSINEGKGNCLDEECCPFRHPHCTYMVCEAWAEHQRCDAGSECTKLHPPHVLVESFRQMFQAPATHSPYPTPQPPPLPPAVLGPKPKPGPKPRPGPSTQQTAAPPPPPPPGPRPNWPGHHSQPPPPPPTPSPPGPKPKPDNHVEVMPPLQPPPQSGAQSQPGPSPKPKNGPKPKHGSGSQSSAPPPAPPPPCPKPKPRSSKVKAVCLNPACPKSPQGCDHGPPGVQVDEATIKRLLQPMELLNRPPNKMEIKMLETEMLRVLFDLQLHDRLEHEIKQELMALSQGVKDIEKYKPNLDVPLKSCGSAARSLSEAICKKLLHWNGLPPKHDKLEIMISNLQKIDFGEAPEKELVPELMALLHVLRSYGNVIVHNKIVSQPMPAQKFDTLLIVTAYAYHACKHFLVLLHI